MVNSIAKFGLAACALAFVIGAVHAGPQDEADAAYRNGDHELALEIYEGLIADGSQEPHVWLRAARLQSWQGDLGAAKARYEAILERWPQNRDGELGLATVLSWDGRHDESIAVYESLLERLPGDREVELGLARTLSWDGQYDRARGHYQTLLSRDAGDVEAMVGNGRTHAWEGDHRPAQEWYDRALAIDPENRDARIGQAYIDLWSGGLGRATRRTRDLEALYPGDREVRKLAQQVDAARAPTVRTWAEQVSDTDDNTLDIYGVRAGWRFGGGTALNFGAVRFEMQDPAGKASIDALWTTLTQVTGRGSELTVQVGVDRFESTGGQRDSELVGELGHLWGTDRRWQFQLRVRRSAIRYSPTITNNRILFDDTSAAVRGRVGSRWRLRFEIGSSDVSDGNTRDNGLASATYQVPVRALKMELGYTVRAFDYGQDLNNGYFDPKDFLAHGISLHLRDTFGSHKAYYDLGVAVGLQSYERGAIKTTNDVSQVVNYLLGLPLGRAHVLELYGNWGDYAAQNAGGFESRQVGLRWVWRGVK